jgi:hypothetical protein
MTNLAPSFSFGESKFCLPIDTWQRSIAGAQLNTINAIPDCSDRRRIFFLDWTICFSVTARRKYQGVHGLDPIGRKT